MNPEAFSSSLFVRRAAYLVQEIADPADAIDFLNEWPEHRRDPTYEVALSACYDAYNGRKAVSAARHALLRFAEQAAILEDATSARQWLAACMSGSGKRKCRRRCARRDTPTNIASRLNSSRTSWSANTCRKPKLHPAPINSDASHYSVFMPHFNANDSHCLRMIIASFSNRPSKVTAANCHENIWTEYFLGRGNLSEDMFNRHQILSRMEAIGLQTNQNSTQAPVEIQS
ncbi:DUF982 domain-containing protein [Mesorhizobium amorphae]|uniref:DUF982 domain-containing protein n=1 Tax=Mesorhizobium amorphae TaxID=71433 RepID=UPI0032AFB05F